MSPHKAQARVISPGEANRMLPLVRRIVADILERGHALNAILGEGSHRDAFLHQRVRTLEGEILVLIEELEDLGCRYQDWGFNLGRVDFPSRLGDRDVYLTWRSDEPRVAWFRDLDDAAEDRRPIPESELGGVSEPPAVA